MKNRVFFLEQVPNTLWNYSPSFKVHLDLFRVLGEVALHLDGKDVFDVKETTLAVLEVHFFLKVYTFFF